MFCSVAFLPHPCRGELKTPAARPKERKGRTQLLCTESGVRWRVDGQLLPNGKRETFSTRARRQVLPGPIDAICEYIFLTRSKEFNSTDRPHRVCCGTVCCKVENQSPKLVARVPCWVRRGSTRVRLVRLVCYRLAISGQRKGLAVAG